jgi:NADH-quinone oxidoreductase subunit J
LIVFVPVGLIAVICAVMVLRSKRLAYAALWLAGLFLAIAGLFLTLGAEFLAVVQVLIYAGAVITLILFAIMLASREGS